MKRKNQNRSGFSFRKFGQNTTNYIKNNTDRKEDIVPAEKEVVTEEKDNILDTEEILETIIDSLVPDWVQGIGDWVTDLFEKEEVMLAVYGPEIPEEVLLERSEEIVEYVTQDILKKAFGVTVEQEIIDEMNRLFPVYEINTPERQAHFLAQVAHESNFQPVGEGWGYGKNNF